MSEQSAKEFWKRADTQTVAHLLRAKRPGEATAIAQKAGFTGTIEELKGFSPKNTAHQKQPRTIRAAGQGGGTQGGGTQGGGTQGGGTQGGGTQGVGKRGRALQGFAFRRPIM